MAGSESIFKKVIAVVIAKRCPLILTFSPEGEKEIAPVLSAILSYPAAALRMRMGSVNGYDFS